MKKKWLLLLFVSILLVLTVASAKVLGGWEEGQPVVEKPFTNLLKRKRVPNLVMVEKPKQ